MRIGKTLASVLLAAGLSLCAPAGADDRKQIVGAVEQVEIAGMRFAARVDTGAETTSVHAENIVVASPHRAKGKPVTFRIVNEAGQSRQLTALVAAAVTVKTSEGKERRYKVPLAVTWNGREKTVLVTLNDRRALTYRVLLGRNWLRGDYLVDVDVNSDD